MGYKSRSISIADYITQLQLEYICTEIRFSIYQKQNDKRHFGRVMKKKRAKIESISKEEGFANMFEDAWLRSFLIKKVISEYGVPKFIYNERVQPDQVKKQYRFPYSGTLVYSKEEGKIGVTDYVDFDSKSVFIQFESGTVSRPYHYQQIKRLSLQETDRYYYFVSGEFVVRGQSRPYSGVGYDFEGRKVHLLSEGSNVFEVDEKNVRRLLWI